jgi:hypothetical protein
MAKKILIGIAVVLVLIQFVRIDKNDSGNEGKSISTRYHVPEQVQQSFKSACNDCHSNKTAYPWYSNIQPVAWWLNDHVNDGKRHLNLSEFTGLPIAVQNHKLEEIIETVKEGEMPLNSYTWFGLHHEAVLSDAEKTTVMEWAQHQMDSLKSIYPADSLKMKRRPQQAS